MRSRVPSNCAPSRPPTRCRRRSVGGSPAWSELRAGRTTSTAREHMRITEWLPRRTTPGPPQPSRRTTPDGMASRQTSSCRRTPTRPTKRACPTRGRPLPGFEQHGVGCIAACRRAVVLTRGHARTPHRRRPELSPPRSRAAPRERQASPASRCSPSSWCRSRRDRPARPQRARTGRQQMAGAPSRGGRRPRRTRRCACGLHTAPLGQHAGRSGHAGGDIRPGDRGRMLRVKRRGDRESGGDGERETLHERGG